MANREPSVWRSAMAIATGTVRRGPARRDAHSQAEEGSYFVGLLEPRRLAELTLPAVIQDAYVWASSPRLVEDMGA